MSVPRGLIPPQPVEVAHFLLQHPPEQRVEMARRGMDWASDAWVTCDTWDWNYSATRWMWLYHAFPAMIVLLNDGKPMAPEDVPF